MVARRDFPQIYLPLLGVAVMALWTLTAYLFNPILLPAAGVVIGAIVLALRKPEYALAIVLALIPFVGAQIPQPAGVALPLPGAPLRGLLPLMTFTVLFYGLLVRGRSRTPLPSAFVGICLLILAAVISAVGALEPSKSIADVFLLITAAGLFLAVIVICRTRDQLLIVLGGALTGLLLASVQGVVQQIFGIYSTLGFVANGENLNRIQGSFGHPNAYAGYLALLLPVAAATALSPAVEKRLRLLAATAAGFAVPALIYSYSRTAMATLIAGALIWLVLVRPRTALAVGIAVAIVAVVATPSTLRERFSNSGSNDVSLRTDVASSALDVYEAHPFFGVGVGNFQVAYGELNFSNVPAQRRLFHNEQLLVPDAAPSQFLNTLAEQGLLGVVALLIFALQSLVIAYRASKARDPTARAIGLGFGMALAAAIIYSTLEVTLQEDQVLALFPLIAIAAIAQGVLGESPAEARAEPRFARRSVAEAPVRVRTG